MTVRSNDMHNDQIIEPGVISRAAVRRSRTTVEKALAWGVLALSWLGSVVTAHGGWAPFLAIPSPAAIGIGLAMQAVLTYAQWAYDDNRWIAWPARAIDALLTALGYGFLFVRGLAALFRATGLDSMIWPLGWWQVTTAGLIAWAIIYLVSLLVAWYPEKTLVR
mgnify:FL=1